MELIGGGQTVGAVRIFDVFVIRIGPRTSGVVDVRPRQATVLPGIAVNNYADFLNFVLAEHEVSSAGIVQVQIRIVVIHTVDVKEVGVSGKAIRRKVAVTGLGVHANTVMQLHDRGQAVPGIGNFVNLPI